MRSLSDLVIKDFYEKERPVGLLLSEEHVLALGVAATRFYAAYEPLLCHKTLSKDTATETIQFEITEKDPLNKINGETMLTAGEWAIIRPLFFLYCERETALNLEASRGMGAEAYGRSSSEIQSEITQYEADMPQKAFLEPVVII